MHCLIILLALLGTSSDVSKRTHRQKGKWWHQRSRNSSSASTAVPEPEVTAPAISQFNNLEESRKAKSISRQEQIYKKSLPDEELQQLFHSPSSIEMLMNLANDRHDIFVLMALIDTYPWESFRAFQGKFNTLKCSRDVWNRIIKKFLETQVESIQTMMLEEFGIEHVNSELELRRPFLAVNILETVVNEDIAQYVFIFALQKLDHDFAMSENPRGFKCHCWTKVWLSAIIRCLFKHPNFRELSIRKTRKSWETNETPRSETYDLPQSILCSIFGHQHVLEISKKLIKDPRHLSKREREKLKVSDSIENASTGLEATSHVSKDPNFRDYSHGEEWVSYEHQYEENVQHHNEEFLENYQHQYMEILEKFQHQREEDLENYQLQCELYEEDWKNYFNQYDGCGFTYFTPSSAPEWAESDNPI